jgi:hypothetical protein
MTDPQTTICPMKTRTLIIAAVIIAATSAVAIAPLATLNAMAAPNGSTTTTCVHNGNGADKCTPGSSSTTVTCTKIKGKYECTSG